MKIKEIQVKDYGPITDFVLRPGDFEIIFGLNESGKTTIVEAITYIIFKRNLQNLRYGKPEYASVTIDDNGKTYSLPAKKTRVELPKQEISPLLYVQASESALYDQQCGGARFWDGIKLMLSQSGSNVPFAKLSDKIFDVVGLMPKKAQWKREKQNLVTSEEQRHRELANYIQEIGAIEKKRLELVQSRDEQKKVREELNAIENSKKYKNYQELLKSYNNYLDKKNSLSEYERYQDEYSEEWQKLEADRKASAKLGANLRVTEDEVEELETRRAVLRKNEEIVAREGFENRLKEFQGAVKEPSSVYTILSFMAGFVLLALSFALKFSILIPFVVFALSIILFVLYVSKKSAILKQVYQKADFLERTKLLFPNIKKIDDLAREIENMKNDKIKVETSLKEKKEFLNKLSSHKTVTAIDAAINELRNKTGLAEFSQLQNKINEKRKILQEISEAQARIFGILVEKDEEKWQRLIQARKIEPPAGEADLERAPEVRERSDMLEEKIRQLQSEIEIFEKVKRAQFNITDDYEAYTNYMKLQNRLEEYELEKNAALKAYGILNELSSELDNFIDDLARGEESLSKYFAFITEHYQGVMIENRDFTVVDKMGTQFVSDKLSSGAKDQLLLCFRLAALRRIYPQGTFLILDDAFIFADWQRRQRLAELLKRFVSEGNQIIYLTSDDHTRDLFQKIGAHVTTI